MKIGLTFDLKSSYLARGYSLEEVAEFDSEETILALEKAITKAGFFPEKIGGIKELVQALAIGKNWDLIFNFAEGLHGMAREAQIPALLEAYQIPFVFSDAETMLVSLNKAMAKDIVAKKNIPTPKYQIINSISDLESVNLAYPVFAKPVAEGTSKGVSEKSKIDQKEDLISQVSKLLKQFKQPVLLEEFLPGREFTIGIIGSGDKARAIGALEVKLKSEAENWCHSYKNKEEYESLVEYFLVDDEEAKLAEETALRAWSALNCRDAGRIDIRSDQNSIPNFIEANPLAGLHPVRSDLTILASQAGIGYDALIAMILEEAIGRLGKAKMIE